MNQSTKHTPGPWAVFANPEKDPTIRYYIEHHIERTTHSSDFEQGVAEVDAFMCQARPEEAEATAALISAAPDLLEACEALVEWHYLHAMTDGTGVDLSDLVIVARAAIAKATGGK